MFAIDKGINKWLDRTEPKIDQCDYRQWDNDNSIKTEMSGVQIEIIKLESIRK